VLNSWRRLRSIRFAALVLFGVGSIVAYAVTATFNGEPSPPGFRGWVAVLERADAPHGDQVKLTVLSLVPGTPGSHPELRYLVSVCGDHPFDGLLITGGDARLIDVGVLPPTLSRPVPTVTDVPNLTLTFSAARWSWGQPRSLI
jgi:hypothetical protein